MSLVLDVILGFLTAMLMVPMAVLVVESLAALLPPRRAPLPAGPRPRCAVLIPAHDEESGIAKTLTALQQQLQAQDQLLVVADNCTDRTAEAARAAGANVVERSDTERRGKGYALDFGVRALQAEPPAVVVIVDADCLVHDGAIDLLVRQAAVSGRPAQAVYLMQGPPGAGPRQQLSAFAFLYKNLVRPRGLDRLGLPCLLTGSGMAFPWPILEKAALASGNIVEDMQMGIDLALAGSPARLCALAQVSSELPAGGRAAGAQRSRWEHGHVRTMLTQAPRLLGAGLRGRLDLLGLALELSVPPLSMLFLLAGAVLALALGGWALGGSAWPSLVVAVGLSAVGGAVLAAWARFGRALLPPASLLAVPFYVLWKVPIYLALVLRPQRAWVRTERATPPAPERPAS
jgi:cellulose synthase/poly-beta-1,6-N-acetylglucosamine synthase-like glycosyltransferase